MPRRPPFWLLAACVALLGAARAARAAEVTVQVLNNLFSPENVTLQPGDTVVWVNDNGIHNVVANDGSFSSGPASFGWTFRHTFDRPGTFFYYCQPHAVMGMRGRVRVVAAADLAAPEELRAAAISKTGMQLTWSDLSGAETGYRVERAPLGGSFGEVASLPAGAVAYADAGLSPATFYRYRVRAAGAGGAFSPYSAEAGAATDGEAAPCVAGETTLCLAGGRFKAGVAWQTGDAQGLGTAVPLPSAPDSGLFYFFSAANIELLVKALDGCGVNGRYWVFAAATTNVELTLTVTDTQTGKVRVYYNPRGQAAAPIQDTDAFSTCP